MKTGFLCNAPALKKRRSELRKSQTEVEKALWGKLRNRQLSGVKFFRQYSLGSYILDFYSPKLKLAIELDGSQHVEQDSPGQTHLNLTPTKDFAEIVIIPASLQSFTFDPSLYRLFLSDKV